LREAIENSYLISQESLDLSARLAGYLKVRELTLIKDTTYLALELEEGSRAYCNKVRKEFSKERKYTETPYFVIEMQGVLILVPGA
jgi:hypothetical protein